MDDIIKVGMKNENLNENQCLRTKHHALSSECVKILSLREIIKTEYLWKWIEKIIILTTSTINATRNHIKINFSCTIINNFNHTRILFAVMFINYRLWIRFPWESASSTKSLVYQTCDITLFSFDNTQWCKCNYYIGADVYQNAAYSGL